MRLILLMIQALLAVQETSAQTIRMHVGDVVDARVFAADNSGKAGSYMPGTVLLVLAPKDEKFITVRQDPTNEKYFTVTAVGVGIATFEASFSTMKQHVISRRITVVVLPGNDASRIQVFISPSRTKSI